MKYMVRDGDDLWQISKRYLGKGYKWKKIYSYNYDIIGDDPDIILPGQILEIPKYKLYVTCLKFQYDQIAKKVASGQVEYLHRLFKIQDELISESFSLFVKSMILMTIFVVILVLTLV